MCLLTCCAGARASDPATGALIEFDIPAQPLDRALIEFSAQANLALAGLAAEMAQFRAPAIHGRRRPAEVLERLLADTGLRFSMGPEGGVTIIADTRETARTLPEPVPLTVLEEVVVSATRRAVNLQDTPIAVTAVSQTALDRNQAKDLRDLTDVVPGLEMTNTGPQSALLVQLRGIGTTNITEIADGPVAFHVDGVYSPRSQSAAALLYDVDRVEVLRGPQGTLFGRNATAGAINVFTRQPRFDRLVADMDVSYGSYRRRGARGVVNLPLSGSLALRVAAASETHDAYTDLVENYVGRGPHYPQSLAEINDYQRGAGSEEGPEAGDQQMLRLSARWQPDQRLNWFVSAERYTDKGTSVTELDPSLVERGERVTVSDTPSHLRLSNSVLRSRLDYTLAGDHRLTYVAGWATMERRQGFDRDKGRDGSFEQQRTHRSRFEFNSHELQLLNSDSERLRWILGAFYSRERNDIVFAIDQQNSGADRGPVGATSWISDDPGAAVAFFIQPDRRVESKAIYAQGIYSLDDRRRLTLGVRHTRDTKADRGGRNLNCRVTSTAGPYVEPGSVGPGALAAADIYADAGAAAAIAAGLPYDGGTDDGIGDQPCWVRQVNDYAARWKNTSGLIRYEMDVLEDALVYGSVATGFKSGHIQDAGNEAEPEEVLNYELGLKSTWLDHSMRLNAALYLADYDDLQFSNEDRFDTNGDGIADRAGSTVVRNAAQATVKGVELELEWALTEVDHLQLVLNYMDAKFDEFQAPDTLFGNLFNPFVSPQSTSSLDPVDLSGNSPVRSPDWKLTLVYERDMAFARGRLTPRVKVTWSDEYFLDIYNRGTLDPGVFASVPEGASDLAVQDAYAAVDFSLRYVPRKGNWSVAAYINNATDETIKTSAGDFITPKGLDAIYQPPRTVGVTLSYQFR